jgi:CRISPR-associated protein Csb2
MTFAIVAELPLGTYRASGQDGRPERLPSVARLHSALLSAAGFGPRAVPADEGRWSPCPADEAALRWLEENPPDTVHVPALEVTPGRAIAYRDDGTVKKSKSSFTIKKLGKHPEAGASVGGRFVWAWREPPPAPVRAALESLCPDVPYLGTTESPVRLTAGDDADVPVTHELDPEAGMFTTGATAVDRPLPGRFDELTAAHVTQQGAPPSAIKDKCGTDEKSLSPVPPRRAVGAARYRARDAVVSDVPWTQVLLLALDGTVHEADRVRWAVAAHRALISLIGDAPSLITGAYPKGARRPANRVALHLLDPSMPVTGGAVASSPATLAVLVPRHADPVDVGLLYDAAQGLSVLRGPGGRELRADRRTIQVLPGDAFWAPPAAGHGRRWRTAPATVPDTRGPQGLGWTFFDAALLSVAFAWKGQLPEVPGRGDVYQRGMAAAAAGRGVTVENVSALRRQDVARYVHRVNDHAVVRPYVATLSMGDLTGPGTVQAIGQSRHLGGGLLVPVDAPMDGSTDTGGAR